MRILAFLIVLGALLGAPDVLNAQVDPKDAAPALEIPVPGLELTPIIRDDERITIPWLAQYIGGVYTFLISIVGVVAAVAIAFGGFQYLTSAGDSGKIGAAKTRMANALIGMVLALGSYVILYAINPGLVSFDGLRIMVVRQDTYEESLNNSTADTGEITADEISFGAQTTGPLPTPPSGCPFTLEGHGLLNWKMSHQKEFFSKVLASGLINASSIGDRIVQAAQIADVCDTNLHSCGNTAGTLTALGSYGTPNYALMAKRSGKGDCVGPNGNGKCGSFALRTKHEVPRKVKESAYGYNCNWTPGSYDEDFEKKHAKPAGTCVNSSKEARAIALNLYKSFASDPGMKGWPDAWANDLEAGDYITFYNGNKDIVGNHAAIFLAWETNGIWAKVIEGGGGPRPGHPEEKKTRTGRWCLKSACGAKQVPLTGIRSPD